MTATRCPRCGAENETGQWACSACGASFAPSTPAYDRALRPTRCPVCAGDLVIGTAELRTGGHPLDGLIDAGVLWSFLPVTTATCVRCGHIDLYAG